jgi:glutamate/tyrosine decarboxylase-like PLP-dependent enzyme
MEPRPELDAAITHARRWLADLPDRAIPASVDAASVLAAFPAALPDRGSSPVQVIEDLVAHVEPGLMASQSGRFYGWVMGGTLPAALAADWLVSAWDQNAGMRDATPGVVAVEDAASRWLLDVLGLPEGAGVGFVTGATMANFTGLAAARDSVLAASGWDVAGDGLAGAPRVRVLAGAERHSSIDVALRYLGLGHVEAVAADDQGRVDPVALRRVLKGSSAPTIVCLQAGNVHSGSFDPFLDPIEAAHEAGAWVRACPVPIPGRPTRTRPSTPRTTAGSRSWRIPPR